MTVAQEEANKTEFTKHKVSTDALETLGTIIDEGQRRDAIHLAVLPAIAGQKLTPGEHVGVNKNGEAFSDGSAQLEGDVIGIVDPFLSEHVWKDQRFWLVVYPRVITSLRHVWTHPSIPDSLGADGQVDKEAMNASENWLRQFVDSADCGASYEEIMEAIDTGRSSRDGVDDYYSVTFDGERIHISGRDAHGEIPEEFWHHVEVVLARKIYRASSGPSYFSCSC